MRSRGIFSLSGIRPESRKLRIFGSASCKFSGPPAAENHSRRTDSVAPRCLPVLKYQSDTGFVLSGASPVSFSERSLRRPASGYRNRTSGALSNVGTNGYAWSSSPNASGNVNAGNLNFNASYVNPLNNANRANGFPVRCVRAFTAAGERVCRFSWKFSGPAFVVVWRIVVPSSRFGLPRALLRCPDECRLGRLVME